MTHSVESCKRSVASLKGRVTYFKNILDDSNEQLSKGELESMLDRVKTLYDKFDLAVYNLQECDETAVLSDPREEFETNCRGIETRIRNLLDGEIHCKNTVNTSKRETGILSLPLPEIPLPKFIGSFVSWIQFRESFLNRVHEEKRLNSILKFTCLQNCLRGGSAFHFIDQVPNTSENYTQVWATIFDHYENEPRIKAHHMKAMYYLNPIKKENNAFELLSFINTFWKQYNALKSLDVPVHHWDLILGFHVCELLDPISRQEIENIKPNDKILSIKEIMDILSKRARILESISSSSAKVSPSSSNNMSKYQTHKSQAYIVGEMTKPITCIYCKQPHSIRYCQSFENLNWNDRNQWVISNNLCRNCFGHHLLDKCSSKFRCFICHNRHHTLLHYNTSQHYSLKQTLDSNTPNSNTDNIPSSSEAALIHSNLTTDEQSSLINTDISNASSSLFANMKEPNSSDNCLNINSKQIVLATAVIYVESPTGVRTLCRTLLDSGSQCNFITENLCQKLGTNKKSIQLPVTGIDQKTFLIKNQASLKIQSRFNNFNIKLDFLILPHPFSNLPLQSINFDFSKLPLYFQLADPNFHNPQKIDMLLGAEIYFDIIKSQKISVVKELPPFQSTIFGYVLSGRVNSTFLPQPSSFLCCDVEVVRKEVQRFYEIEDISPKNNFSIDEKSCKIHYVKNVKRDTDGRYTVALPTRPNITQLGDNYKNSERQFLTLEKKLASNETIQKQYTSFMNEYISLGHMEPVQNHSSAPTFFLPHHAVFKENSSTSKLRVVFNASSKSSSGLSLNDALMTGPTIQQDLFSIILRFRKHHIALVADITKMYRQVKIHEFDRGLQQIVWRDSTEKPLQKYQLNTVTYGTASAPFLAIRTLKQLAIDEHLRYPKASSILLKDFYVDDCVSGENNILDALKLKNDLTKLLASGGFELTKWASNKTEVVSDKKSENLKVLGIEWCSSADTFHISIGKFQINETIRKRTVLSQIAQLFDPLGLCAAVIFTAKVFMQKLWSIPNLYWDDELPKEIYSEWIEFLNQLNALQTIEIPRCIIKINPNMKSIELHGFGDASERGYGCCIYLRTIDHQDIINCHLLSAKSKVAPLKRVTIPRLELCASLLLSQLCKKVHEALEIVFDKVTLWSDSEVTLYRINSPPSKYATFVANRISQIQDMSNPSWWNYIPSDLNPADLVSRGMMPSQLKESRLWWHGPAFLFQSEKNWPKTKFNSKLDCNDPEVKQQQIFLGIENNVSSFVENYSNFNKLIRVTALCLRFLHNLRFKTSRKVNELTLIEIDHAKIQLTKSIQPYPDDIKRLSHNEFVGKQSFLRKLNPFIDTEGVLRVGGRLNHPDLPYEQKHPIVIPSNNNFSKLLVRKEHISNLHAGPQALLSFIRQQFRIIGGRNLCKKIVHECIICFKNRSTSISQIMGELPPERVQKFRAFENVGVDFCGPFNTCSRARSKLLIKVYISIFICFSTKATHIEVVNDLSTNAFMSAFRRFISRRGRCSNIFSDNATNFVGANSNLRELQNLFNQECSKNELFKFFTSEGINWQTIPPRSPHFGGLWEAAVKSAKHHLKRSLGNYVCTLEELMTLTTQIEACLNSRPLSPLSADPSDLSPLTPGHFLIGGPINAIPEPSLFHLDFNRLSRYQRLQHVLQQIWKRWSCEYLSELQQRHKWLEPLENIKIGTIVLLKEENTPPIKWVLGRVIETHPGSDSKTRVVTVKTLSGIFKRAITRVCPIPIETENK